MASKKRGSKKKSSRKSVSSRSIAHKENITRYVIATRLSPYAFGHSLGIVTLISLLLYAVMYWFGNYDPTIVTSQYPLTYSFNDWTIIIGLIQTYVLGYIGGWIFAKIYNRVQ